MVMESKSTRRNASLIMVRSVLTTQIFKIFIFIVGGQFTLWPLECVQRVRH
jgi:hypothetical protein